ncbi:uncharacterized protein LOC143917117 [Arctopsyche grandis]|uniref:uncharacterized protein LOC143917117 n=1 Tax=Arctopsyche grandis TaxID=121162 RepID=UPI00406D7891
MKERKLTDVAFAVGNRSFFAHIVVLSACSEFFIENRYRLSAVFSEFNYSVIDAMLKYCYTGNINIDNELLGKFMELAKKLEINSIVPPFETIDATNCLEVLSLSDDPKSREKAMSLTIDNFKTLYKNQEIVNLPVSTLADILKLDKLNVSAEEVFESVKLWIKSDETNRKSELADLLSFVKLPSLSMEFLVKEVLVFCSPYEECIGILQQAIESITLNSQSKLSIAEQDLKNSQSKLSIADQNLKDSQSRLSIADQNLRDSQSRLSIADQNLRDSQSKLSIAEQNLENSQSKFSIGDQNLKDSQSRLSIADQNLRDSQSKLSIAEQNLENSQSKLSIADQSLKDSQSKLSISEHDLENSQSKLSIADQNLKDSQSKLSIAELKLNDCESDKIALIGDLDKNIANTVDVYNGKNNIWTLSKNFNFDRNEFASVLVKKKIMIIGGVHSPTSVDCIDLKDGQKHSLKPLNYGRWAHSAVTHHHLFSSDVYAIGGYNVARGPLSSMERWNSNSMKWNSVAQLLMAVHNHSASIIDAKIYVTGGRASSNNKKNEISIGTLQVYSVDSNSWFYGASMIRARQRHSSIAMNGKLYVGGGIDWQIKTNLNSVESYDPNTNLWTDFCTLPIPAYGISLCFFQNKLLSMGGSDGVKVFSNVWEYDEKSKNWIALQKQMLSKCNRLIRPFHRLIFR